MPSPAYNLYDNDLVDTMDQSLKTKCKNVQKCVIESGCGKYLLSPLDGERNYELGV